MDPTLQTAESQAVTLATPAAIAKLANPFEFYPTPAPFTRWLFEPQYITVGRGCVVAEVCCGSQAIVGAVSDPESKIHWVTNDLDPYWDAEHHFDATSDDLYRATGDVDWVVTNPPFSAAVDIINQALKHARVGVAMLLRISIHEPTKTGPRRTWLAENPPNGILFLPRFAYQRSRKDGQWATDSVTCCWCIWRKDHYPQFIDYAPDRVIAELQAYTPTYRAEMDRLMLTHAKAKGLVLA